MNKISFLTGLVLVGFVLIYSFLMCDFIYAQEYSSYSSATSSSSISNGVVTTSAYTNVVGNGFASAISSGSINGYFISYSSSVSTPKGTTTVHNEITKTTTHK
jgi:hypothetical protein